MRMRLPRRSRVGSSPAAFVGFRECCVPVAAAILAVGVVTWLRAIHELGLGGSEIWAGTLAHTLRDSILVFPLALLAIVVGDVVAQNWQVIGQPVRGLLRRAGLIALLLGALLLPTAIPHQVLDRTLDGAVHAHYFHGPARPSGFTGAPGPLGLMLVGLRDALLSYLVAWPLTVLLVLLVLPGQRGTPVGSSARASRWYLPAAGVLMVMGLVTLGLGAIARDAAHHRNLQHTALVTEVTVGAAVENGGMRITVQSARWLRQPKNVFSVSPSGAVGDTPADPDRLYLDVTVDNLGAVPRRMKRAAFRIEAPDGRSWWALASDFPALELEPQERFATRFIFELPQDATRLRLAWNTNQSEGRIAIADDDFARLFAAICRAVSAWRSEGTDKRQLVRPAALPGGGP